MIITDKTFTEEEKLLTEFLMESNAIEEVYDSKSIYQALKAWEYLIQFKELTKQNILNTHAKLMKHLLDRTEAGAWRRVPVWIGGKEAKSWYAVPDLMEVWIQNANIHTYLDKEDSFKRDHITFEGIHPFVDGNGRLGRILLNWQRVKAGLPILVIKEAEKEKYYEWFKEDIKVKS